MQNMTTAWMWQNSRGGVNGVNLDPTDHTLQWFDDAAGCACAESIGEQSFDSFRQDGALLGGIPADVHAEIVDSIHKLTSP